MKTNEVVTLKGSDHKLYKAIPYAEDGIKSYASYDGLDKTKVTRYYYELSDGRMARENRFGEFQIDGTNITLAPVDE